MALLNVLRSLGLTPTADIMSSVEGRVNEKALCAYIDVSRAFCLRQMPVKLR